MGPQEVYSPIACSQLHQLWLQTRLFLAPLSSWVLKTSKDRDCTTSLGNWFQCLAVLKFFFASGQKLVCYFMTTFSRPPT